MGNKTSKKVKKRQEPIPTMYPLDNETIRIMTEFYNPTPAIHNLPTAPINNNSDDDEDAWSSNSDDDDNIDDNDNVDDNDNIDEPPQKSCAIQPGPQLIDKHDLYHELLVHGYAREIESFLSRIVPLPVIILCCEYYEPPYKVILIYLPLEDEQSYCQKIIAEGKYGNRKTERLNVFELNNENELKQERMSRSSSTMDTLLLQRNMSLPQSVTSKLCAGYNKYYDCNYRSFEFDTYSLLFSLKSSVVAVNEKEFNKNEADIIGIKWDIPDLPNNSQCVQFSNIYGLLGFAGYRNNDIYNLSFNNNHYIDQNMSLWKWQLMTSAKKRRNGNTLSSVMIDNNKLMIIGGLSGDDRSAEIIDLQRKKVKPSNTLKPRSISGIVYDENKKRVLIAGGDQYLNTEVEIYDTSKDIWTLYDGTYVVHYDRPILWITNNDILYMATCKGDIKYIDLRVNTKEWMIHQADEFGIGSYIVVG